MEQPENKVIRNNKKTVVIAVIILVAIIAAIAAGVILSKRSAKSTPLSNCWSPDSTPIRRMKPTSFPRKTVLQYLIWTGR